MKELFWHQNNRVYTFTCHFLSRSVCAVAGGFNFSNGSFLVFFFPLLFIFVLYTFFSNFKKLSVADDAISSTIFIIIFLFPKILLKFSYSFVFSCFSLLRKNDERNELNRTQRNVVSFSFLIYLFLFSFQY